MYLCTSSRQDPGIQVQQLQTRSLVGSERRELREEPREGFPPRPPLRIVRAGTGKHPRQMVTSFPLSGNYGNVREE